MDPEEFEEKARESEKKKKKPKMKVSGKSVFLLAKQSEKIENPPNSLDELGANNTQSKKKKK